MGRWWRGAEPSVRQEADAYRVALPLVRGSEAAVANRVFGWMSARRRPRGGTEAEFTNRRPPEGEPWALELSRHRGDEHEVVRVELHRARGGSVVEARVHRAFTSDWLQSLECGPVADSRTFRAPTLVPDLIRTFGAYRDRQVLLISRVCDEEDAGRLLAYLRDPGRTMPVLVLSPVHGSLDPLIDPGPVARSVAGLAHVFTLTDDDAAERIGDALGGGLACAGGTMRLYWPRPQDAYAGPHGLSAAWDGHALCRGWRTIETEVLRTLLGWWGEVGE